MTMNCWVLPMAEGSKQGRPGKTAGLRHVALYVRNLEACERFYVDLLGMDVEWRPDRDNVYLTSGNDNLALHRRDGDKTGPQSLDHIGFILNTPAEVDQWHEFLLQSGVEIAALPKTHRDGARSFYIKDPDGNAVQLIYHPPIAGGV
jgi:catechol 2,3-dioxygenase-like lactoylglutathione lyase family enzyme